MKKRTISVLLAAAMIASSLAAGAVKRKKTNM